MFVLEHGYCRSLYCTDPDGMIVRVHRRSSGRREINAVQRRQGSRRAEALAGRRSHVQQHVPLSARR